MTKTTAVAKNRMDTEGRENGKKKIYREMLHKNGL